MFGTALRSGVPLNLLDLYVQSLEDNTRARAHTRARARTHARTHTHTQSEVCATDGETREQIN